MVLNCIVEEGVFVKMWIELFLLLRRCASRRTLVRYTTNATIKRRASKSQIERFMILIDVGRLKEQWLHVQVMK
jgi:hypothetical protein